MTRRKKIWLGLLGMLVIGTIALAAFSGKLIKPALEYAIRSNGFPNANIETVTVIPNGLLLETVYLDADAFSTIETVQIKGSWFDIIFEKHISAIELKNVELSGEVDEQGQYIIAGWNASLASENTDTDKESSLLIENIDVNGLTLDFETPEGAIRIEGKLALQSKTDKTRDFQANLWGKQKQLSLNATAIGTLQPDGQWNAEIELLEGRVDLASIKATRASGLVKLKSVPAGITYSGKMAAGGVRIQDIPFQDFEVAFDSHNPDILQFKTSPTGHNGIVLGGRLLNKTPLTLEATASISKMSDVIALFSLKKEDLAWLEKTTPLELKISAPLAALSAPKIDADWSLTAGSEKQVFAGQASYVGETKQLSGRLTPVTMSGKTAGSLFPLQDMAEVELTSGTVTVAADFMTVIGVEPLKIDGTASLSIKDTGGMWQEYPFTGVNGTLNLTQLLPWTLAKNQTLRADVVGTGINLTDGVLTVEGQQNGSIAVKDARFKMAGGTVSTQPFKWNPDAKENAITLQLENISLDVLAKTVAADGFSAEGELSGSLPMSFTKKGIVFKDAVIGSTREGNFRYSPKTYPAALRGDDQRMQTVRTALSDFRYSNLEIAIGGDLNGDLKTTFKASGKNPVFEDRVINLNINLEGALVPVLQEALQPGKIADRIEKSVRGGQQ